MTNYYVAKKMFSWMHREMKGNLITRERVKYYIRNSAGNIGVIGHMKSERLRTWVSKEKVKGEKNHLYKEMEDTHCLKKVSVSRKSKTKMGINMEVSGELLANVHEVSVRHGRAVWLSNVREAAQLSVKLDGRTQSLIK